MKQRTHITAARRGGEAGFTLVEVLAGLALASLIFLGLNLAMDAVRSGVDGVRGSLGRQAELSSAAAIFSEDAARIVPVPLNAEAGTRYLFSGAEREMTYPVFETRGVTRGGLYRVRLRVEGDEQSARLIRDRVPLPPGKQAEGEAAWQDEVVLLDGPYDIAFAYRDPRRGARDWTAAWSDAGALPGQLRLTVTDRRTGRLSMPVLVQPLEIDSEAECAARGPACAVAETLPK